MTPTSILAIIAKLLRNGLGCRLQRLTGAPSLPQAISLEITRRCVARCIMCNIWRNPEPEKNLTIGQWLSLLDDPLFARLSEVDITGGEPFLRRDLFELIAGICAMAGNKLPQLASIAITTNGLLGERVTETTSAMLTVAQRHGIHLVLVCAVDALDDTHDRIRNYPGAWSRVNRTIETLDDMRKRHPNLILGLKTTIVPQNVDRLAAIRKYAVDKNMFSIISPFIITPGRYLNADLSVDLAFSQADTRKMIAFYREVVQEWGYHADAMVRVLTGRRRRKTCSAGCNYFFVRSNGDMMLCPLIARSAGNVARQPVAWLYNSRAAAAFRRKVAAFPSCRNCTEPGLERYALTHEGFGLLAYWRRYGRRRFLEEFRHLGLDKLIDMERQFS